MTKSIFLISQDKYIDISEDYEILHFANIFKQFRQGHHYVTSLQSLLSKNKPNLACVYRWWFRGLE